MNWSMFSPNSYFWSPNTQRDYIWRQGIQELIRLNKVISEGTRCNRISLPVRRDSREFSLPYFLPLPLLPPCPSLPLPMGTHWGKAKGAFREKVAIWKPISGPHQKPTILATWSGTCWLPELRDNRFLLFAFSFMFVTATWAKTDFGIKHLQIQKQLWKWVIGRSWGDFEVYSGKSFDCYERTIDRNRH